MRNQSFSKKPFFHIWEWVPHSSAHQFNPNTTLSCTRNPSVQHQNPFVHPTPLNSTQKPFSSLQHTDGFLLWNWGMRWTERCVELNGGLNWLLQVQKSLMKILSLRSWFLDLKIVVFHKINVVCFEPCGVKFVVL